jgi:hypothetical protein
MRLLLISPFILLTASYFSCYVNTFDSTSYLQVHISSESGNVAGASAEIWRDSHGQDVMVTSQKTGSDGSTTFELPAGTSEVRVHFGVSASYESEVVSLKAGETKAVEFFESTTGAR